MTLRSPLHRPIGSVSKGSRPWMRQGWRAVSSGPHRFRRPSERAAFHGQAERAQLSRGLNSGVLAGATSISFSLELLSVDVLAPIGIGQSMLICGPEAQDMASSCYRQGTGKSILAKQAEIVGRQ